MMIHCQIEDLTGPGYGTGRRVYAFCGAGGKTSGIHALRDYYLARGKKVLVTTTTHMLYEDGCVSTAKDAVEELWREGYAFAGILIPPKRSLQQGAVRKIKGLPDEERLLAEAGADIVLIEADGARCLPFKVPKPWEPVIPDETTDVVLVIGLDAVGRKIREVCYNPEGVAEVLGVTEDACLTPQMMVEAYRRTYVALVRRQHPGARIFLYMNEKVPGRLLTDCDLYQL